VRLDEIRKATTFQEIITILVREQIHFSISPPMGERGRFYVQLYDRNTGEIGTGSSPNAENALILATASLERANLQRAQDSAVANIPDAGDILASKAS
jgi:hypothetical protein